MGRTSILSTGALAALFMVWSSCIAAVSDPDSVGLRIVATHTLESDRGVPVISIKGTITNESERGRALPHVRIAVSDAQGREIYHWRVLADEPRLGPHESCTFSARLESPPEDAVNVDVRFAEKGE